MRQTLGQVTNLTGTDVSSVSMVVGLAAGGRSHTGMNIVKAPPDADGHYYWPPEGDNPPVRMTEMEVKKYMQANVKEAASGKGKGAEGGG